MAANLQSRKLVASFGKRFSGQIRSPITLRSVHDSVYDKNLDENNTHSAVVPDHVIQPQTEEYWAPHPKTGVFGPAKNENPDSGLQPSAGSVLEEKAFFRPQEDLDKPPVQP